MKPLNRPMFKMGGPIKEGIMDGIREPKKKGGMLLVGEHPKEFKASDGREKHLAPVVYGVGMGLLNLARAAPAVYRGFRAARTFAPGKLGTFGRIRDIFSPSGRFRKTSEKFYNPKTMTEGVKPGKDLPIFTALRDPQRLGAAIRENPTLAFTLASSLPQASVATYKAAIAAGKSAPELAKLYVDLVLPGEQFRDQDDNNKTGQGRQFTGDEAMIGDPRKPLPDAQTTVRKPPPNVTLTDKEKRNQQIEKYRDIMDIKGMNKDAAYDSLIAASKAISESGDFKGDIKSGKLINQIIQGASKAFDKPKATKDAIDTLILKGEIEKDIKASDPSNAILNELRKVQIKKAEKDLESTGFAEAKIAASKNLTGQAAINAAASVASDNFKGNLITKTELSEVMGDAKKSGEISEEAIIIASVTEVIKGKNIPDGDYTVGDVLVTIKDNAVVPGSIKR